MKRNKRPDTTHRCFTPILRRKVPRRGCFDSLAALTIGDGNGASADCGGTHRNLFVSDSCEFEGIVGAVTATGDESDEDDKVDIDRLVFRLSRIVKSRKGRYVEK